MRRKELKGAAQIADHLGVSDRTVRNWVAWYPELAGIVRKPGGEKSPLRAWADELDAWMDGRSVRAQEEE